MLERPTATAGGTDCVVPEEALLSGVLRLVAERPGAAGLGPIDMDTTLQALNVDSLALAELIACMEEELSTLLELRPEAPVATLGDLRRALHPIDE
jgi:acyl carrier protein